MAYTVLEWEECPHCGVEHIIPVNTKGIPKSKKNFQCMYCYKFSHSVRKKAKK